jgi:hypothetical protein
MPANTITPGTPGHPYDNGIHRPADRTLPPPTVTTEDLPAYCGPLTDMNRGQRCRRRIAFAERRLCHYLATWDLPACTCGAHKFTEPTHDTERALPACTC